MSDFIGGRENALSPDPRDEADTSGDNPLSQIATREKRMNYTYDYRAYTTHAVANGPEHQLELHRQCYTHVRWDSENSPEDHKPNQFDQNNAFSG